ncbi:MAG: hypothetical protein VW500_00290 [Aquiluna sp.]|jgi:hypothetical protein
MKNVFWPVAIGTVLTISYLYHPSVPTILGGAAIGAALAGLIIWSSSRIGSGKWFLGKLALLSLVAGIMNATALDVLYSLLAAPEGNRFILGIESLLAGLVLTALGWFYVFLGSKEKK